MPHPIEPLYTYQDLLPIFRCHYDTLRRWFKGCKRFNPTRWTVRIPESEVKRVYASYCKRHETTRKRS
jgi:hypothetical protein